MKMRGINFVACLLLAATASGQQVTPPGCSYGEPHQDAPAELAQFAFLIGDYSITLHAWQGDSWSPPQPNVTARWNGYYGLGGMVIVDEWFNPDPAQNENANRGINVRMFDPEENLWKLMWIATADKTVQDLRAEMRDGVLTMWQLTPERPNFKAIFNVADRDHWERVSFTRDDQGQWVRQFRLAATRIPCVKH